MTRCFDKESILVLALAVALSLVAFSPLLSEGWYSSHDGDWHIERLMALTNELRAGDFYPRWLSVACYGKGLPIFNYYSPGLYLIAGLVHLIGFSLINSFKSLLLLSTFIGFLGMFVWIRKHCGITGALIAATIYTFLPYHFLDLYVRGALPEFVALSLLPYLFHAIDLSLSEKDYVSGIGLSAISSAALLLTHNLTTIMIFPFALFYLIVRAASLKTPFKDVARSFIGPVLGAGMSAFYWLPLLMEAGYLKDFRERVTTGRYLYSDQFVYPSQFFSSFWGFGPSVPGINDGMSFQVGIVLIIFVLLSVLSLFLANKDSVRFGLTILALGGAGLFLTLSISSPVYESLVWFKYVQFPWRFIGIATFFLSAFTSLTAGSRLTAGRKWLKILLYVAVVALCIFFSEKQRSVNERSDLDYDLIEKTNIADRSVDPLSATKEYLPRWVGQEDRLPLILDPIYIPDYSSTHVNGIEVRGSRMRFEAVNNGPASDIVVTWFYFPGWKATVDGIKTGFDYTDDGFIRLDVPSGKHKVEIWFGSTWPRITGWLICLVTILAVLVFGFLKYRGRSFT